ncbi:MAG: LmbE family protein, partial [Flavobacteriaceae bacterium]
CQGFGRISTRGSQDEYVELLKGDLPKNNDLFDGINTTWSRVKGGKAIGDILYKVEEDFDFIDPSKHVSKLVEAYQLLQRIEDKHWKALKSKELESLILACSGLYLEISSESASTTPGNTLKLNMEALNRSSQNITIKEVKLLRTETNTMLNKVLVANKKENLSIEFPISETVKISGPYWLKEAGNLGMYTVKDQKMIGNPETPSAFEALIVLNFDGTEIGFKKPVVYRYSKPDKGELYEPFVVLPEVTSSIKEKVLIFSDSKTRDVAVTVKAGKDNISGKIELQHPNGWKVSPTHIPFSIDQKGQEQSVTFRVTPPTQDSEGKISSIVSIANRSFDKELVEIAYDHIPKQSILLPSEAKVVRMNIQKSGEHIGYIVGAGDKVPESLEQIGYQVHTIDPENIQKGSLDKYDAIVVGIRAYNVVDDLKFKQPLLFDYVANGGNMIVQYNTAGRWSKQFENIAPYDLTLSRDRVTDETAQVNIIARDHSLVNFPNKIQESDFDGWVQERGLYFPKTWSEEFTPILSMGDEGESPKDGSLLVAPHGKGNYIYTGLSFFRELPAGVSGAYKLFANMLSVGKSEVKNESNIKG